MSEKVSAKVIIDRKDVEDTITYLENIAKDLYHLNHALFDNEYKSKLDWNNERDVRTVKMTLFLATASINREVAELEEKLRVE